jgi:hypothetical protein
VFTFNGDSKNSSVIDPVRETVIKTIDMGGGPEQPVFDGKGSIYDNNEETSDVVVIDTHKLMVKTRWSTKPAEQSVALALDREHHRLFSAGRNPTMLVMMNADNGKVLQSFPITAGVDANIYDPATGLVFSSTRAGVLHVFHEDSPDKLTPMEEIKTEYGAKTMGLDPKTQNLFLVTSDFTPPTGPKGDRKAIKGTARGSPRAVLVRGVDDPSGRVGRLAELVTASCPVSPLYVKIVQQAVVTILNQNMRSTPKASLTGSGPVAARIRH